MLYLREALITSDLEGPMYCLIQISLETIALTAPGSLYFRIWDTLVFIATKEHNAEFLMGPASLSPFLLGYNTSFRERRGGNMNKNKFRRKIE